MCIEIERYKPHYPDIYYPNEYDKPKALQRGYPYTKENPYYPNEGFIKTAPARPQGKIRVRLKFKGRSKPIPEPDPSCSNES